MTNAGQPHTEILRRVTGELAAARVEDEATMQRSRASLEWLARTIPRAHGEARRLARLGADAIRMLQAAPLPPATSGAVLDAVRAAVSATAAHLDQPPDAGHALLLSNAGERLLLAMGRAPQEWRHACDPLESVGATALLSLDDAVSLMCLVTPNERDELEHIMTTLADIGNDQSAVVMVRTMARQAQSSLKQVLTSLEQSRHAPVTAEITSARATPRAPCTAATAASVRDVPDGVESLPEDDHDLIADFLVECRAHLKRAEFALRHLEAHADDPEDINTVLRAFHTMKGTAAFLHLDLIRDFAHEAESLFSRVRDRELPFAGGVPKLAFEAVGVLDALLRCVRDTLCGRPTTRPPAYARVLAALARAAASRADAPLRCAVAGRRGADDAVLPNARPAPDSSTRARTDQLDRLSLSLRTVPLDRTMLKMTRLVRDVAKSVGKQVVLLADGGDTAIDRDMADALGDALAHMLRNAVDHGIESAEARTALGKPAGGTVRLTASTDDGVLVIELTDDGRGLDRSRILQKGIEQRLVDSHPQPSDAEIFGLVFVPGFSTATEVTRVSGRGVGMDVVKHNVESLGGDIEITSTAGEGTTFTIRLPLAHHVPASTMPYRGTPLTSAPRRVARIESTVEIDRCSPPARRARRGSR